MQVNGNIPSNGFGGYIFDRVSYFDVPLDSRFSTTGDKSPSKWGNPEGYFMFSYKAKFVDRTTPNQELFTAGVGGAMIMIYNSS